MKIVRSFHEAVENRQNGNNIPQVIGLTGIDSSVAQQPLETTLLDHVGWRTKQDPRHPTRTDAHNLLTKLKNGTVEVREAAIVGDLNQEGRFATREYIIFNDPDSNRLYMAVVGSSDGSLYEKTRNKKLPKGVRHAVISRDQHQAAINAVRQKLDAVPQAYTDQADQDDSDEVENASAPRKKFLGIF